MILGSIALLPVVCADATEPPDDASTASTNLRSPAVIFMCTVTLVVAVIVWVAPLEDEDTDLGTSNTDPDTSNAGPGIVKRALETLRSYMGTQVLHFATLVTTVGSLVVVVRMNSDADR